MKSKKLLSLAISICLGTFAFAVHADAAMETNANATATQADQAQMQKNGEILAFIMTVDKNEIALADLALTKQTTPAIKDYAEELKKQHTANLEQVMTLSKEIAPVDSEAVVTLQQDGAKGKEALSQLNNKEFDKAYIDAMVTGHTAVLKMIDDDFMKNASNASVKEFVVATRPHIEAHLQKGQEIQKELNQVTN